MSRDSSIQIKSEEKKVTPPSVIISALLTEGWSYDDQGHISFTVSEDLAHWQRIPLSEWTTVSSLLDNTYLRGASVGISLLVLVRDEASGGDFLFDPTNNLITINLTIKRKEISCAFRVSDYSWYLSRLLEPIESTGYSVSLVECRDYW